jgi:hypothetical protein
MKTRLTTEQQGGLMSQMQSGYDQGMVHNGPEFGGPGYGYGPPQYGYGYRIRPQYPVETKPFFLTSEFWGAVIACVGIAITAASSDAFGSWRAWVLIAAIVVGYQLSRGIAKSGTKSRSGDPREDMMSKMRERSERNDHKNND